MKKIVMLLMVAVLMLGVSGQAMAAFEDGHLVRVVFSADGENEIADDLGVITDLTLPSSAYRNFGGSFDFATLGANANASNTYVSYFAVVNTQTEKKAWVMGPETSQYATKTGFSGFVQKTHTATGAYQVNAPGSSHVVYNMSNTDSFWSAVNGGGMSVGKFGTLIPSGTGAVLLTDLETAGYVDQKLYYYTGFVGGGNITGVNVTPNGLRINANGSSEMNPAVPIPAAVYLFGSGLLGLVGLRRKMAA